MKKIIFLIIIISFLSCQKENTLIGKWEKINDSENINSQIEIYAQGEKLFAKRIQLSEINQESGWTKGDICWKELKKLNDTIYSGVRIAKRLNNGVTEVMEVDFTIKLLNNGLLTSKAFYSDNRLDDDGKIQTFIKIK